MDTWVKAKAKLIYAPSRPGMKKQRAADDFLLVAELPGDIARYYSWWIKKKLHLDLQLPVWRPHVTVLDGRRRVAEPYLDRWKKHAGKMIEIEYSVNVEQHWKFWVLPVRSEALEDIRDELGFMPSSNFHVTVGRMF